MTEITFHFNVPHRLSYSSRLVRKAYQKGASVVVIGAAEDLVQLGELLWNVSPVDFIPHCSVESPPATVAASAVVLADTLAGIERDEVVLNIGHDLPEQFERFQRLIEIVTADEHDRAAARLRWKHYASRGYAVLQHDLAAVREAK